ncbi:MAG: hypothetical protein WCD55_05165 [Bacteroidales bacterium]
MKTRNILFFGFCLAFLFPYYTSGQSSFIKHYETRESVESDGNEIIAGFNQFVKDQGFSLPSIPKIKIQTEPFLIKLDRPNNTIIVPYWDDLTNDQKEIIKSWRGENAEEFFVLMFNWFFIAHELSHYINPMDHDLNPYQCEREANEVAVTFFRRNPENFEKLDFIKKSLTKVLEILPKIDFGNMSEAEYFNANYQKIGSNPNVYGYFQFKFILDILNNQKDFSIKQYFDQQTK